MPNAGTVVRLTDGRIAAVARFSALGDDDRVVFSDGHEEPTNAWQIAEMLTDEAADHPEPVEALRSYLASSKSSAVSIKTGQPDQSRPRLHQPFDH